jgi:hypothetical protein
MSVRILNPDVTDDFAHMKAVADIANAASETFAKHRCDEIGAALVILVAELCMHAKEPLQVAEDVHAGVLHYVRRHVDAPLHS